MKAEERGGIARELSSVGIGEESLPIGVTGRGDKGILPAAWGR